MSTFWIALFIASFQPQHQVKELLKNMFITSLGENQVRLKSLSIKSFFLLFFVNANSSLELFLLFFFLSFFWFFIFTFMIALVDAGCKVYHFRAQLFDSWMWIAISFVFQRFYQYSYNSSEEQKAIHCLFCHFFVFKMKRLICSPQKIVPPPFFPFMCRLLRENWLETQFHVSWMP